MLSSRSLAFGGLSRVSHTVRQSLACSSVNETRLFHTAQTSNSRLASSSLSSDSQNHHQLTSVRHRSNRSRRGLYDGKDIRSGNNVSFSMKATKRKFKPNVFKKRVYSEILDEMIQFHITTSALRSIDKAGGLDNYLLTSRHVSDEGEGYEVKKRILKVLKRKQRMEATLAAAEEQEASIDDDEEVSVEEEDKGEDKR